jgi:hypothetical protein
MSSVVIAGDVSGTVTLDAPANAGTTVLTLPATTGTFITTTGGVAPSTSGNVLTSNGTAWTSAALPAGGVTSLNGQTGAITNTDYGAIGSYVVAFGESATNYNASATAAGSVLHRYTAGTFGGFNTAVATTSSQTSNLVSQTNVNSFASLSLSGTWRCMTQGVGTPAAGLRQLHLWVRIS